jgi:HK97 family phage portal protein
LAKLPLVVYEAAGDDTKRRASNSPVARLLDNPNPEMSGFSLREVLVQWACSWGNGYAEIVRSGTVPIALYPIHPSRVQIKYNGKEYMFLVRNDTGTYTALSQYDMLHIHGASWDGVCGISVLRFGAQSLGLSIAAQTYGANFFNSGAAIKGVLEHPAQLSNEAGKRLRESWKQTYGGADSNQVALLEEGMKFSKISAPPEEAQFLETRNFQVEDVCRWFRMPPGKVQSGERAKGWSTVEAENTSYVVDTLMPWAQRIEAEIERKLFNDVERERFYVEHLFEGLLRGDTQQRAAFYEKMFMLGVFSSNDIRRLENMNPREDGDEYYITANVKTPEMLESEAQPTDAPSATFTSNTGATTVMVDDEKDDSEAEALKVRFAVDALKRCYRKESMALGRMAKKGDDLTLATFYDEQAEYYAEALGPIYPDDLTGAAWCRNNAETRKKCATLAHSSGKLAEYAGKCEGDAEHDAGQFIDFMKGKS